MRDRRAFLRGVLGGALGALLPLPLRAAPARLVDGALLVVKEHLDWRPDLQRFLVATDLPATLPRPMTGTPGPKTPAHMRGGRTLLDRAIRRGGAAGFAGLLYDNRDNGHSRLDASRYPGLVPVRYGGTLWRENVGYGLAETVLYDRPVVGNSSTAYKRSLTRRSLPRSAMTRGLGPVQAYRNYRANHIYVYPEHKDYDRVDLFPATWPYMLVSRGSSYRDRPFVEAALWALGALRPDTRAEAERSGRLAPTVQMILRRTQAHVRGEAGYLGGPAHPTVFDQGAIRMDRIVALAQSLTPETLPPVPALEVLSESFAPQAGLAGLSERLFDTPGSVARIWRDLAPEKEMVLAARADPLPPGAAPRFRWVLLRGDPGRVRIEPLDPDGRRVRLAIGWHDRRPVGPTDPRLTDRVDIGLFVQLGDGPMSAPAFVSVSFPTHEIRRYEAGRLREIDYDARGRQRGFDPLLHWSAPWRDIHAYAPDGSPAGWTRHFAGARPDRAFAPDGTPRDGAPVDYRLRTFENRPPILEMVIPESPAARNGPGSR